MQLLSLLDLTVAFKFEIPFVRPVSNILIQNVTINGEFILFYYIDELQELFLDHPLHPYLSGQVVNLGYVRAKWSPKGADLMGR